jgi:zinc ribbon protein
MYCPRCGHQPISNAMRFCSYCGFKLGVVKASLADDDDVSKMDRFTRQAVPKEGQRDANIGVILMFVGALLAGILAGRGGYLGREGGAIIVAVAFSSIIVFSRPILKFIYNLLSWEEPPAHSFSVSQRRMMFGSMLMFISTILVAISSLLMLGRMRTPEFFLGLVIAFVVILLISKQLIKALRYLVGGDVSVSSRKDEVQDPVSVAAAASGPALTAGQDMPVSLFTAQRVTTAEILSPASVTEQTTNLLENK